MLNGYYIFFNDNNTCNEILYKTYFYLSERIIRLTQIICVLYFIAKILTCVVDCNMQQLSFFVSNMHQIPGIK